MREAFEFRIPEPSAERYLPSGAGTKKGIARQVEVAATDPLFEKIGSIDRQLRAEGRAFFTSWAVCRQYRSEEIAGAAVLYVWPKKVFEPAGEECGTTYDESGSCKNCGAGAVQTSPLFLPGRSLSSKVDFSATIADEVVVSARVADLIRDHELRGAALEPVRLSDQGGKPSRDHLQFRVTDALVELAPSTRLGEAPFDVAGHGRCPQGDLAGLNLISEVFVKRETLPEADFMSTRQWIGVRRGLLRPRRLMLLSPRAWTAFHRAGIKGLGVEVAHLE